MSAAFFYRPRILGQFNIPQIQPGAIVFVGTYVYNPTVLFMPAPTISLDTQNVFSEIDATPTLTMNIPVPTISVLATSP